MIIGVAGSSAQQLHSADVTFSSADVTFSAGTRISSKAGVEAVVDSKTGLYEIIDQLSRWRFAGEIGQPVSRVQIGRGADPIGHYREISFTWGSDSMLAGSVRLYDSTRTVILSVTASNNSSSEHVLFPRFTQVPNGLHHFSYKERVFAPPSFALEGNCTPWLLFDDTLNAIILSAADNFLASTMEGDGVTLIAAGLNRGVHDIPDGFKQHTVMVFGRGINSTWDAWGDALTKLGGKTRPSNDADIGLRYLGYWTDNGATYYYNYDHTLGYSGTLQALVKHYHDKGIPLRYLQLDSWWYDKSFTGPDGTKGITKNPNLPEGKWNRYGGAMEYSADSMLFPQGLPAFQRSIGIPLMTHNRWIDPASPYHDKYKILGFAPVDSAWWNNIMSYLATSGVVCYEQDWLSEIYKHSPELSGTALAGRNYLDWMQRAAARNGLSLQYCMAFPRFFLAGSRYSNLTTIRVSDDRFARSRWDSFLYTSQLVSAVGIWPWADVFMSSERDNLLLSTLSGGMVGIGDEIGKEDKANILRAVRPDGVIIKPDVPIVPADEMYREDAAETRSPMIAWTYTDHCPLRTVYVYLYNRRNEESRAVFFPSSFGLKGDLVVYDTRTGLGHRTRADSPISASLGIDSAAYYVIAPVGVSGIAFFGDEGKFICNGRKRISALEESHGELKVTITFASGENSVRIFGYVKTLPALHAISGSVGELSFDPVDGRFEASVSPGPMVLQESPGGDPIRQATIMLEQH